MPKLFSKLLISFLAGIILVVSLAPMLPAQAQTTSPQPSAAPAAPTQVSNPWYSQNFGSWYAKVYGGDQTEIFGERYTAAQVNWVFWGVAAFFINLATGFNPAASGCIVTAVSGNASNCIQSMGDSKDQINNQFTISDNGKSLIGMIFEDRSLSGITYVKEVGRKFRLVPEAKAQSAGFGYSGALGVVPDIQKEWVIIRNVSYAIFVFVIMIFAFMIMFRVKISPQVVVTVQSALPKIAIGLILVTFSYAIAGFLIDIMYIVIGILSLIFSQFTVFGVSFSGLAGTVGNTNSVTGYFTLLTQGPTFLGIKTGIFGLMIMYIVNYFLAYIMVVIGGFVSGLFGAGGFIGGSIVAVITLILGLLGLILVFVLALLNFFKIIILLARAFLTIILLTIFAPLQLTLGIVIPGLGFGSWLKSYVSALAIFPGVGVMFILSLWFLQIAWNVTQNAPTFFSGGATNFPQGWPPLLGGSPQLIALAFLLASIVIFSMIPKVGKMIEGLISGKFNLETGIGEPVAYAGTAADVAIGRRIDYLKRTGSPSNYLEAVQSAIKMGVKQFGGK